jgi:hypothetical protein
MRISNPADNKQLYVKIPADLFAALEARCRKTGRSGRAEIILALGRYLVSPIDGEIVGLPKRIGKRINLCMRIPAAFVEGLEARSCLSWRTVTAEFTLAMERHLIQPAEPLLPRPVKVKRPRGRPRKSPLTSPGN